MGKLGLEKVSARPWPLKKHFLTFTSSINKIIIYQFSVFESLVSIASVVGIFMYLTILIFKQVLRSRKGLDYNTVLYPKRNCMNFLKKPTLFLKMLKAPKPREVCNSIRHILIREKKNMKCTVCRKILIWNLSSADEWWSIFMTMNPSYFTIWVLFCFFRLSAETFAGWFLKISPVSYKVKTHLQ